MTNELHIDLEKRLMAKALYELRVLLADHLDSEDKSPVADAAWLAYALHNQALSVLDGQPFDVTQALKAVDRLDTRLGAKYVQHFRQIVLNQI